MPALPLDEAGKYVAAAYIVVFALVLIYVAIMAIRLSRMERELGELLERVEDRDPPAVEDRDPPASPTPLHSPAGAANGAEALDVGRPETSSV